MKRLKVIISSILLTSLFFACSNNQVKVKVEEEKKPKYVFLFIGDGMGMAQRSLTEYYKNTILGEKENLYMHTLPVAANISTHSSDSLITDSGAAATALSSGYKTYNGAIGVDSMKKKKVTIIEALENIGFSTGLITSTRITHATPASFASHQDSRSKENEIAFDYLNSGVDFLAGGGYRHFVSKENQLGLKSKRTDKGLLEKFNKKGYDIFLSERDTQKFLDSNLNNSDKVLALFSSSHIPYVIDRDEKSAMSYEYPSLDQMTKKGIEFLYKKSKESGFFLMVEGGRIDHAAHANDPIGVIYETLELDNAIKEALDFYKKHPNDTLILITADHETGGLTLGGRLNDFEGNKSTQEYNLYLDKLVGNHSIEDVAGYKFQELQRDRKAFIKYLEDEYGLGTLSKKELEILEKAMDDESDDNKENDNGKYYSKSALAISKIIALRANIGWTTELHTGIRIPLSAIGQGAEFFNGYYDNAQVPIKIAHLLGIRDDLEFTHDDHDDEYQGTNEYLKNYHKNQQLNTFRDN